MPTIYKPKEVYGDEMKIEDRFLHIHLYALHVQCYRGPHFHVHIYIWLHLNIYATHVAGHQWL